MNPRTKGNRTRRLAIEYYKQDGWVVDIVEKTGKFIVHKDLYSSICDGFDLICLKKNEIKFIQVKTNTPPKQKTYIEFAKEYCGTNLSIEGFTWYDRDGILIQQYNIDGTITRIDLRKIYGKNKKKTK